MRASFGGGGEGEFYCDLLNMGMGCLCSSQRKQDSAVILALPD